jgi:hypothetical protein
MAICHVWTSVRGIYVTGFGRGRSLSLLATSEHPASGTAAARDPQLKVSSSAWHCSAFYFCTVCHTGPVPCAVPVKQALRIICVTVWVQSLSHGTCTVSPHCATYQPWHSMDLAIRKLTALLVMQVSVTNLTFHLQSEADSRNLKGCI